MHVMIERCAALDIHKKSITACVRTPDGQGGRAEVARTDEETFRQGPGAPSR